jgi:mono/diheme cytochrome c family protein
MRHSPRILAIVAVGLLVGSALTRAGGPSGQQVSPASKTVRDPIVTPVAGKSWLNRLGVPYSETTLGRSAATYGPSVADRPVLQSALALPIGRPVVLTGADLYRLNCQACHRAQGTGSPSEIKSVLGLVQGTSLELVRQQLKGQRKPNAGAAARAQASRAQAELHTRVLKGGQRMPPLSHLQEADFAAIYAYLTELAGTPDAPPKAQRSVSWSRLGEHVIKGTCHICHDATGPRLTDQAMAQGAIPPFTTLLEEKAVVDFLTKVRSGSAVRTGDAAFHYRGRMPVFSYLKDLEVAAAYMFLVDYPPQAEEARSR